MSDDYIKFLENAIKKYEGIVSDFDSDREAIIKMLKVILESNKQICQDIELLANPKNPSGKEESAKLIRDIIKDKLIQQIGRYTNDILSIRDYVKTDPSEYKLSGVKYALPVIYPVKYR